VDLEEQRARLYEQLAAMGDFRPGSINATYRRCGKPNCACAQAGHRGHGPRYLWTRSEGGTTRSRQLSGAELEKVRQEVANYKEFVAVSEQIVEVSEAICKARPVAGSAPQPPEQPSGERGLCQAFAAEAAAEIERLAAVAARPLAAGGAGLEAAELAIRTAMAKLGASLLEQLLAADSGYRGPRADCVAGHEAGFVSYRPKTIDTVLGPVTLAGPGTTAGSAGTEWCRGTGSWESSPPPCPLGCGRWWPGRRPRCHSPRPATCSPSWQASA
jgi:hypothetical protein